MPLLSSTPLSLPAVYTKFPVDYSGNSTWYRELWNPTRSVPAWLLIVILPLISVRSPAFFTRFNALGTVSIFYLCVLVIVKAVNWGIHLDFTATDPYRIVHEFRPTFVSLTGVCSLAFFIHNAVHAIMRGQRHPENNKRDLLLAFALVAFTYVLIGGLFYAAFPLAKSCIEDNFLNNISSTDMMVFVGRIALFFQMLSVFPLLVYILRVQIMHAIFKNVHPSDWHCLVLHVILLACCLIFAMFVPSIGIIIRFVGALCGLVYIFALPMIVYLMSERELLAKRRAATVSDATALDYETPTSLETEVKETTSLLGNSRGRASYGASLEADPVAVVTQPSQRLTLSPGNVIVHVFIILLGLANFIGQFIPISDAPVNTTSLSFH